MSEDLVSAVDSTLEASGEAASTPDAPSETLPHIFCKQLQGLLKTLQSVFPENEKLGKWLTTFETLVLGNASMEEWVVKKWNYDMTHDSSGNRLETDYYAHTKARNIDALLSSDLWVFKEVSARELYYHEDLDDDDREALCKHFDQINSYAKIYSALPDGMREAIERVTASIDTSQEITQETVMRLLQNMLTGPHANMDQLMSWATQLSSTFADGQGLDAIQTLLSNPMVKQATGSLDVSSLIGSLRTELAGGAAAGGSFSPDPAMLMQCMSMLGMGGAGK